MSISRRSTMTGTAFIAVVAVVAVAIAVQSGSGPRAVVTGATTTTLSTTTTAPPTTSSRVVTTLPILVPPTPITPASMSLQRGAVAVPLIIQIPRIGVSSNVLAVGMTLWMWITPIMIPEQKIPASLHFLVAANPLYYVVRAYRQMLLQSVLPSVHDISMAAAFSVTIFIGGGLFFRHMKRGFADVL